MILSSTFFVGLIVYFMDRLMSNFCYTKEETEISPEDRYFLDIIRGLSITRVVLVHLGLSWFFTPYSEYIHTLLPLLFFVSGAVSYGSFKRSSSALGFIKKRLISIYAPYALLIIILFLSRWIYLGYIPDVNYSAVYNYLTMNVAQIKYPIFPLGQVWFLHSLAIIIIVSTFLFIVYKRFKSIYLCVIALSIFLAFIQFKFNIHDEMFFLGHNFYHPFVYIGFFIFGSWYYSRKNIFSKTKLTLLCIISFLTFVVCLKSLSDINMGLHSSKPDIYYISLSYFFVFLTLLFDDFIVKVTNSKAYIKIFIIFMGRHSYSVFLLHSLVLWFVHNIIGVGSVSGLPHMAVVKILFTILFTCLLAIPFSYLITGFRSFVFKVI